MRIQIRCGEDQERRIEVHFDRRLPRFPRRRRRLGFMVWDECRFDRDTCPSAWATQMVSLNRGHYETELSDPGNTFRRLVEYLIDAVPGVVSGEPMEPYGLAFQIGRCFDAEAIGRKLAQVVVEVLWPDARETMEIIVDSRVSETSDLS